MQYCTPRFPVCCRRFTISHKASLSHCRPLKQGNMLAGAENSSTALASASYLKDLKVKPCKMCPGWWQGDLGVTFEVHSPINSSRGTRISSVQQTPVATQPHANPACSMVPSPHLCLREALQIFKVNRA